MRITNVLNPIQAGVFPDSAGSSDIRRIAAPRSLPAARYAAPLARCSADSSVRLQGCAALVRVVEQRLASACERSDRRVARPVVLSGCSRVGR